MQLQMTINSTLHPWTNLARDQKHQCLAKWTIVHKNEIKLKKICQKVCLCQNKQAINVINLQNNSLVVCAV